jgi:tRNA dimethylallyltransferase
MKEKINIVCGTTASGKSAYGVKLAHKLGDAAMIINADSMQVYREIPILTAQPILEEREGVEHRLYGTISCGQSKEFSAGKWLEMVIPEINSCFEQGLTPILVGGTGMYLQLLLEGLPVIPAISPEIRATIRQFPQQMTFEEAFALLIAKDPISAAKIKPNDWVRTLRALEVIEETGKPLSSWQDRAEPIFPRDQYYIIRVDRSRSEIYQNINQRFLSMIEQGAIEEVTKLLEKFAPTDLPPAHGLPELTSYLQGRITLEEAIAKGQQVTRNYAKRQLTWLNHQIQVDEVVELK